MPASASTARRYPPVRGPVGGTGDRARDETQERHWPESGASVAAPRGWRLVGYLSARRLGTAHVVSTRVVLAVGIMAGTAPDLLVAQSGTVGAPHAEATDGACTAAPGQPVAAVSGRRITAITVRPAAPYPLPGGRRVPLHVTTRPETVRSRLVFHVGEPVDTLRVAESLRQLQDLPYLIEVTATASCDHAGGAALTVFTRDAWSIRPQLSFRGTQRASVGLEETNLFGTGRAVRVYARSDQGQFGAGAAYSDPTLAGGRVVGTVRRDAYAGGSGWGGALRMWDAGVFAPWGAVIAVQQSTRASVRRSAFTAPGDTVRRGTALALLARRVALSPQGATFLLTGAEAEQTALVAGSTLPLVGPSMVRRTFAGIDVGAVRRSVRYVTAPWLLPAGSEPLRLGLTRPEVPLGFEADGLASVGRDFTARHAATHIDLWAGRVFAFGDRAVVAPPAAVPNTGDPRTSGSPTSAPPISAPRILVSADVWASGYHPLAAGGRWSAATARGSLGAVAPAPHGLWSARVSAEHLGTPDPDVRGLALSDPAQRAFPAAGRLAEAAVTASFERSRHLLGLTRNYMLDAALFGAGAVRWETAAPGAAALAGVPGLRPAISTRAAELAGAERLSVASIGAGLRLTPTRFGPATIRFDVAVPIVRSGALSGRPYVGISIAPAFGLGRQRDGRGGPGGP